MFLLNIAVGTLLITQPLRTDSGAAALESLKAGNERFIAGQLTHPNQGTDRRTEVAKGQKPFAVILTCADSRLSPEIIFDQGLGDLFVVRVAGNVIDDFSFASIEYAVEHLGAQTVVVLGHERCGAVKAAVDTFGVHSEEGHGETGHIGALLAEISPAVKAAKGKPGDWLDNSIKENVLGTVSKVVSSSLLGKMAKTGQITIFGAIYDLDSGFAKFICQSSPEIGSSFVKIYKQD